LNSPGVFSKVNVPTGHLCVFSFFSSVFILIFGPFLITLCKLKLKKLYISRVTRPWPDMCIINISSCFVFCFFIVLVMSFTWQKVSVSAQIKVQFANSFTYNLCLCRP
jgi:hypothetical protein